MVNFISALTIALVLFSAAKAETSLPGLRFDLMPVGCRIHGIYGSGEKVVDEFTARSGSKYTVKTTGGPSGNKLIRKTTYNSNGFMVRKDWAGGKWETFAPYSCVSNIGDCQYLYKNADGAKSEFRGKAIKRGKKIISSGGFVGEAPFNDTIYTLGPFNNTATFREGATSYKVTRYENCGDLSPSS